MVARRLRACACVHKKAQAANSNAISLTTTRPVPLCRRTLPSSCPPLHAIPWPLHSTATGVGVGVCDRRSHIHGRVHGAAHTPILCCCCTSAAAAAAVVVLLPEYTPISCLHRPHPIHFLMPVAPQTPKTRVVMFSAQGFGFSCRRLRVVGEQRLDVPQAAAQQHQHQQQKQQQFASASASSLVSQVR